MLSSYRKLLCHHQGWTDALKLSVLPATTPGAAMFNGPMDNLRNDSHFRDGLGMGTRKYPALRAGCSVVLSKHTQKHPQMNPKKCCTSVLQIFSLVWKIYVALESCSQSLLTIPIAASPRPPTVVSLLCFTWLSGGIRIAFYDIELSPKIELWA